MEMASTDAWQDMQDELRVKLRKGALYASQGNPTL